LPRAAVMIQVNQSVSFLSPSSASVSGLPRETCCSPEVATMVPRREARWASVKTQVLVNFLGPVCLDSLVGSVHATHACLHARGARITRPADTYVQQHAHSRHTARTRNYTHSHPHTHTHAAAQATHTPPLGGFPQRIRPWAIARMARGRRTPRLHRWRAISTPLHTHRDCIEPKELNPP
jgi:hypothetical protein